MIVMVTAVDPRVLMVIAVVITIVVALTVAWPRDDASGANRGDGEQQAADCNSCSVFHGIS
jgi:hypothetical protein